MLFIDNTDSVFCILNYNSLSTEHAIAGVSMSRYAMLVTMLRWDHPLESPAIKHYVSPRPRKMKRTRQTKKWLRLQNLLHFSSLQFRSRVPKRSGMPVIMRPIPSLRSFPAVSFQAVAML